MVLFSLLLPGRISGSTTSYFSSCLRIGEANQPGPSSATFFTLNALDQPEDDWPADPDDWWEMSPGTSPQQDFAEAPPEPDATHDAPAASAFMSANSFMGAKRGYYYGTGHLGLGYYPDVTKGWSLANALQVAAAAVPHVALQLNVLVPAAGAQRPGGDSSAAAPEPTG